MRPTIGRRLFPLTRPRSAITARRCAPWHRFAVALASLALLLQSSALLLHHTLAPHHHQLAPVVPGDAHDKHGGGTPDRGKAPTACPVWAALQQIAGGLVDAAAPPALLVFVLVVLSGVSPAPAPRRLLRSAQPRAPPAPI